MDLVVEEDALLAAQIWSILVNLLVGLTAHRIDDRNDLVWIVLIAVLITIGIAQGREPAPAHDLRNPHNGIDFVKRGIRTFPIPAHLCEWCRRSANRERKVRFIVNRRAQGRVVAVEVLS